MEPLAVKKLRQLILERDIKHIALGIALRFEPDGDPRIHESHDEAVPFLTQPEVSGPIENGIDWVQPAAARADSPLNVTFVRRMEGDLSALD